MGKVHPNFHGVKGKSGRKSIRDEFARLQELQDMYFEEQDQDKIEARIRTGKFSIKDRHILNAMEGDQKAINPIVAKIFPDKIEHSGEIESKIIKLDE